MDLDTIKKAEAGHSVQEKDIDIALGVIQGYSDSHIDDTIDYRRLLWKIDLRLMPMM